MQERELFLVEITWDTYPVGESIHRVTLDLMAEDRDLICDSVSEITPQKMIEAAIKNRKGFAYDVQETITRYWFHVLKTTNRSDWPSVLYSDLGAEEMFGGTALDEIKMLRQKINPHDKGEILTLWEMHYFPNDDDWFNEWTLLGAVDAGRLEPALIKPVALAGEWIIPDPGIMAAHEKLTGADHEKE